MRSYKYRILPDVLADVPDKNREIAPSLVVNSRAKRAHVNFIIHLDKLEHLCSH